MIICESEAREVFVGVLQFGELWPPIEIKLLVRPDFASNMAIFDISLDIQMQEVFGTPKIWTSGRCLGIQKLVYTQQVFGHFESH